MEEETRIVTIDKDDGRHIVGKEGARVKRMMADNNVSMRVDGERVIIIEKGVTA